MTYYINWEYNGSNETVDEAETETEAVKLAHEYRMAYGELGFIRVDTYHTVGWED